jgi:Domain of unknown function (DUF4395)
VNAFYVVILVGTSLYLNSYLLSFLLAIDFAIKAFSSGVYSPLKQLSIQTASALQLPQKPTPLAPKKFAALLGFVFSLIIAACQVAQLTNSAYIFGGLLLICALLESACSICIGCYIYTFIYKFQIKK